MDKKISHKINGSGVDPFHSVKSYSVECSYQGNIVASSYISHLKKHECGGCNQNINNVVEKFEGGK
jgi:hypothetical protein